jgi:hypothetical protein
MFDEMIAASWVWSLMFGSVLALGIRDGVWRFNRWHLLYIRTNYMRLTDIMFSDASSPLSYQHWPDTLLARRQIGDHELWIVTLTLNNTA